MCVTIRLDARYWRALVRYAAFGRLRANQEEAPELDDPKSLDDVRYAIQIVDSLSKEASK